ncbi:hypothetical protein ES708_29094 [subsurface metagenome]
MKPVGLYHYLSDRDQPLFHGDGEISIGKHFQIVLPAFHAHAIQIDGIFSRFDHKAETAVHIGSCSFLQFLDINGSSHKWFSGLPVCHFPVDHCIAQSV